MSMLRAAAAALWLVAGTPLTVGAHEMSSRRLQYHENCHECEMVSIVPTSDFVIRGLQFFTELETCLAVQVWHYDGDLKDFSLEGLFSPNPADGWIEICDGFAQGMGKGEPTTIAENHCVPIEIMEGTPNTFHIRAISCTCSEVQQFQVPSNCTCGSFNSKYGNMTHSYAQYSGLPCSAGTNFPTTSGPTYSAPTASPLEAFSLAEINVPEVGECTGCIGVDPEGNPFKGVQETIPFRGTPTINALNDAPATDVEDDTADLTVVNVQPNCPFTVNSDGTVTGTESLTGGVYTCSYDVEDTDGYTTDYDILPVVTIVVVEAKNNAYAASVGVEMIGKNVITDNDPTAGLDAANGPYTTLEISNWNDCGELNSPNDDGSFLYTAASAGTYDCTYTVTDTISGVVSPPATITISATDGVVAEDDTNGGVMNTPITGNVLDNDSQGPLGTVTGTPACDPGISISADGSYNVQFATADVYTCTYEISDNDPNNPSTDTATLTIYVLDPQPDVQTINIDDSLTGDVLTNDGTSRLPDSINSDCSFTINGNGSYGPFQYSSMPAGGKEECSYTLTYGEYTTDPVPVTVNVNNAGPQADPDMYTGTAGVPIDAPISVFTNDSDPEGHTLTVTAHDCNTFPEANDSIVIGPDGVITGTFSVPKTYSCTYVIADEHGGTASAGITFAIQAPPMAGDDPISVTGLHQPVTKELFDNDSDPDGDTLAVTEVIIDGSTYAVPPPESYTDTPDPNYYDSSTHDLPTCGSVLVKRDGEMTFYPQGGTPCLDGQQNTFEYIISDGNGGTDIATVTLTAANVGPEAVLDIFPITGSGDRNILLNDYDGDCEYKDCPTVDLSLTSISNHDKSESCSSFPCTLSGLCGSLEIKNIQGDVTYTSDPNGGCNNLPDEFEYCITDGQGGADEASCNKARFEINNPPDAQDNTYEIATAGLVDNAAAETVEGNVLDGDTDPDLDPQEKDIPDFDGSYARLKVIQIDGSEIGSEGTKALGDGTLSVKRNGEMTYTLSSDVNEITTNQVTFEYTISDFFGGTDSATVTIDLVTLNDQTGQVQVVAQTGNPTASPTHKPTNTIEPTRSPVSAAPVTIRPTVSPITTSYLIEAVDSTQVNSAEGRYVGKDMETSDCEGAPCGGTILGPETYVTPSGGQVTYQFIPDTCYAEAIYDNVGMLNGHFDADWVDVNPGWPGNGHTINHKHTYDDNCECTWVDYFTPTDFIPITQTEPFGTQAARNSKYFKIIIINDNLNRRGLVAINNKLDTSDPSFLRENPDLYIPVIQYVQTPVADLPVYTLGDELVNPDVTKLTNLALGYHADAVTSGPFGIVPSATGSMKGNNPGLNGEWRTGALTIQLVAVTCDANGCVDDFVLDPTLSNSTNQGNMGPVKPPKDPETYPTADDEKVYFEGTLFWHGGDQKYICGDYDQTSGQCNDQEARDAFYAWYSELYGTIDTSSSVANSCVPQELCCVLIDGAPLDQSPPPNFYTFEDIDDDHTISAVFAQMGQCPACSAAPTSSPTISAAPSVSMPPSTSPSTSLAPSSSPTLSQSLPLGQYESKCYGWAYTANNCFTGTFGDPDTPSDGSIANGHWSSTGGAIGCAATVDNSLLGRFPAIDDGNACNSDATATDTKTHEGTENVEFTFTGNNHDWVDGGLEYLDCIEAEFENHETCNSDKTPGVCITGETLGSDATNDNCDSGFYGFNDNGANTPSCNGCDAECDSKDKCHTNSACGTEQDCKYKPLGYGNPRYKVTLKVRDTPQCSTCYISSADFFYYDIYGGDKTTVDPNNNVCPVIDGSTTELTSTQVTSNPLPKIMEVYPKGEYELYSMSAHLWCGAYYQDSVSDDPRQTPGTDKDLCDPDGTVTPGTNGDDLTNCIYTKEI